MHDTPCRLCARSMRSICQCCPLPCRASSFVTPALRPQCVWPSCSPCRQQWPSHPVVPEETKAQRWPVWPSVTTTSPCVSIRCRRAETVPARAHGPTAQPGSDQLPLATSDGLKPGGANHSFGVLPSVVCPRIPGSFDRPGGPDYPGERRVCGDEPRAVDVTEESSAGPRGLQSKGRCTSHTRTSRPDDR